MFEATKGSLEASTYDQDICQQLASGVTLWLHRWSMTDQRYGKTRNAVNYRGKLITIDYSSPPCGCAGDRVEKIVEVHCGTVFGDAFLIWRQIHPPKEAHNALWQPFRPGFSRNLKVANKSYLSHGGEESLGIEEPCHPEHIRSSFKTPVPKLTVSFQKFGVPESKRGRLPWDLKSDEIKWKKTTVIRRKCSMFSRESTFKCVTRTL